MESIWQKAITRDQFPVLILKDNKVVGKARWTAAVDGFTAMRITEGKALGWVEKMAAEHGSGVLRPQDFNPRFWDSLGDYMERLEDGWECLNEAFAGTRAVSEFALNYGMVPDAFKDAEGYRSKLPQGEDQVAATE